MSDDGPPYFTETECYECGEELEILQPKCSDCSAPMVDPDDLERESVYRESEIREIIETMRHDAETTQNGPNYRGACNKYADQLEDLIND